MSRSHNSNVEYYIKIILLSETFKQDPLKGKKNLCLIIFNETEEYSTYRINVDHIKFINTLFQKN